jgi:hypothetical protein
VGLLALGLKIDTIGQTPIEQLRNLGAGVARKIVPGTKELGG